MSRSPGALSCRPATLRRKPTSGTLAFSLLTALLTRCAPGHTLYAGGEGPAIEAVTFFRTRPHLLMTTRVRSSSQRPGRTVARRGVPARRSMKFRTFVILAPLALLAAQRAHR